MADEESERETLQAKLDIDITKTPWIMETLDRIADETDDETTAVQLANLTETIRRIVDND